MEGTALPRRRLPGRKRWLLAALLVLAGAWTAGLIAFAASIPKRVGDPVSRTDAIVVLTGGSRRLATGLRLLAEGKADRLFVSGVHKRVEIARLLERAPAGAGDLACCVEAGHGAVNTAGNAAETAAWMRRHGYHSLRLVTASYHMPRSLLEFRYALSEVRVIPHPVFPDGVKMGQWWRWPGTAALIVGEYNKFLLAWARHALRANAAER